MSDFYPYVMSYSVSAFEFAAAVIATIHYKKYVNSSEAYFLHFLWVTFFVDSILGPLIGIYNPGNTWLYYGYTGMSFLFYYWWYYSILTEKLYKKIILTISAIFIILYVLNGINIEHHKYSFIIGASFVLIFAGFHLHQLFNSNYTLIIKHKLSFWITTALVLFNIGMIPFILLSKYFNVWAHNSVFGIILLFLNMVLYGCYIIGFIWTKKKYNHF
ncbi:hypothetical protein Q4Q39_15600 [Flavivirga amylovorans]|uniref:DUF2306 domain-containing protein n=1 Tax=Flavivirga amylovorans TaxID=870486 RepID=A0ABT8X4L2_9FLAO|nr:hypothetical protein [Flavivirga amylovorans]MDO5988835.1 hypothetical protein [Flavivirga amylovorans]